MKQRISKQSHNSSKPPWPACRQAGLSSDGVKNGGFTLVELLIFTAIFTTVIISFITIFVSVTRIHVREIAAAEVNGQSQFLLQTIQYHVERSSAIEMATDTTTSTLTLRMASSTEDPTTIQLSAGTVYLKQTTGGALQPLTSSKVRVTDLDFTKRANAPGHDSAAVSFAMEYITDSPDQKFSRLLQTAISRVSAATFDSNVVPNAPATHKLGTSSSDWQSINDAIYFAGANVGIGTLSPGAKLQINNGDVYVDTSGRGLVLKDLGGTCWRVMATSTGALVTSSLTCP